MKKIMILGAGRCQVPLIRRAKRMGLTTIVVSRAGDYPGFKEADIYLELDVKDCESILEAARKYKIDAVLTNQTDLPVITAAYVAEKMNLPGIGLDVAETFSNKFLMRKIANECGSAKVECYKVSSLEDALNVSKSMTFPLVIKPPDSQGSRGVGKVRSKEELISHFAWSHAQSPSGTVILETYFEGREVTVDGLMNNSRYQNFLLGDVEMFNVPEKFIPKSIIYPSTLNPELKDKVFRLNRDIVKKAKLPFGLTHAEYRVCEKTKEVFLLEIAARGGGMFISSDLVPLSCGLDVENILLKQYLGISVGNCSPDRKRAAAFYCIGLPEGKIINIKGMDAAGNIDGVHRIICDLKIGDRTTFMDNKTSRAGVFIISGDSRAEVLKIIQKIRDTVTFLMEVDGDEREVTL